MTDHYSSIHDFLNSIQVAKNHGSKDVRLSIDNAIDVATSLAHLFATQTDLLEKNQNLMDQLSKSSIPTEVRVSGGKF